MHTFEISVQVTAGNCPVDTYIDTIVVEGPPSVNIDVNGESSDQICLDSVSISQAHQIDFSSQLVQTDFSSAIEKIADNLFWRRKLIF